MKSLITYLTGLLDWRERSAQREYVRRVMRNVEIYAGIEN